MTLVNLLEMQHTDFKSDLQKLSEDILIPIDFHDKLAPAIMKYHDLLCNLAAIDSAGESDRAHIETDHGNAIGPFWAANCVKEIFRTQRFVRGLAQAITDLHQQGKKLVHVLYAGTGPFATLALPIMLHFAPSQVQFTLLEINGESYNRLQSILEKLELTPYVRRMELADASNYKVKDQNIDILLSETMNLALHKEPQVSIMLNLGQQLKEQTIFIPEQVKVGVGQRDKNNAIHGDKTIMLFDKKFIRDSTSFSVPKATEFEEVELQFNASPDERFYYITEIVIYKSFKLGINDSSLTLLKPIKPFPHEGELKLVFQYQISSTPGFVIKEISRL